MARIISTIITLLLLLGTIIRILSRLEILFNPVFPECKSFLRLRLDFVLKLGLKYYLLPAFCIIVKVSANINRSKSGSVVACKVCSAKFCLSLNLKLYDGNK